MNDLDSLMGFERERLAALVAGDTARAFAMHRHDFELVTPRGVALSRQDYLDEIRTGGIRYIAWEPSEMAGHVVSRTGVLRYRSQMEMESDGHRLPTLRCWHTDYYEFGSAGWQVVYSQATAIT